MHELHSSDSVNCTALLYCCALCIYMYSSVVVEHAPSHNEKSFDCGFGPLQYIQRCVRFFFQTLSTLDTTIASSLVLYNTRSSGTHTVHMHLMFVILYLSIYMYVRLEVDPQKNCKKNVHPEKLQLYGIYTTYMYDTLVAGYVQCAPSGIQQCTCIYIVHVPIYL